MNTPPPPPSRGPGSGPTPAGTSSGSVAGQGQTGVIDRMWFGAATPVDLGQGLDGVADLGMGQRVEGHPAPEAITRVAAADNIPHLAQICVPDQNHPALVDKVQPAARE